MARLTARRVIVVYFVLVAVWLLGGVSMTDGFNSQHFRRYGLGPDLTASVRRNIDRQADFTAGGVPRFSADYNGCSSCLIAAATLSTTAVPAEASAIPINPTALNKPVTTTNATVAIVIATKATLVQS